MSGDGPQVVKNKQRLLFGPIYDFYISELVRAHDNTNDRGGIVINRILLNPDITEDKLPYPDEWGSPKFDPTNETVGKRLYALRDSVIDFRASAELPENRSRGGAPILLYRRDAARGYGLSRRQHGLAAQLLLRSLDQTVESGVSMVMRAFGNFYVPAVSDFKKVASTGQSTASSNVAILSLHGFGDGKPPSDIEKAATAQRLAELNKDLATGAFGAVYRGLPYGDYAWNRSVAIRIQRIRPSIADNETPRNYWMLDARLMLYVCHIFETYRVSKPERNNFCPAFYSGKIGIVDNNDAKSLQLVTVHSYWDGTLDRAILFDGKPVIKEIMDAKNLVSKTNLVTSEIARIWKILNSLERFAVAMLALGDGSIGESRIVHGDLKMNNVVLFGPNYTMGVIDFGMTAIYSMDESNKGGPPQRELRSEFFKFNTPHRFDGFLDFAYLRYTTRAQLMLWAEQMYLVTSSTPIWATVKSELMKIVMHVPFINILSIPLYHYYLSEYASKPGTGWIYTRGVDMTKHNIKGPFEQITGIQINGTGFYECEDGLINSISPIDAGQAAYAKVPNTRWEVYKTVLKNRNEGRLLPLRVPVSGS